MENVRESNTLNALMHNQDLAWSKQQYEDQKLENRYLVDLAYNRQNQLIADERAYTDPAAVKKRYLEAGINPYLASQSGIASGSSGNASVQSGSAPSSNTPSGAAMQAAHAENNNGLGFGLSKIADLATHYVEMEHDLAYKKQMANNDSLRALADWSRTGVQNAYTTKLTDKLAKDMLFDEESWDDRLDSLRQANNLHKQQAILSEQQAIAQKFTNSVAPELHQLQKDSLKMSICIGAAQVANINANTSLTEQQKKTEIERTCQEAYKRADLPKSLHNENAIRVATYNQIKAQAGLVTQQTKSEKWRTLDLSKNKYQVGTNREMRDYFNYASDAFDAVQKNNNRGFFRSRP